MELKELIEAYIAIIRLQEKSFNEFLLIDNKSKTSHNILQYIKEGLYEKIKILYPEFLTEPFIINEHIVIWSSNQNTIILYPKKEIK